jgi:ribose-phosphate pyrophosphokinase
MEPQEISRAIDNVKIISTNSNVSLAEEIAKNLGKKLVSRTIKYHANTEIKIQISESIRGYPVYIIATGVNYNGKSVNDHLMEILCMADACKRSDAKSICLIIPCFPYARSDKKDDGRCIIGAKLVSDLLLAAGITRIISIDLHAGQIQGFTNVPFDNLYAIKIFCDYLKHFHISDSFISDGDKTRDKSREQYILVSPDNGGVKRVAHYAKMLRMPFAIMSKQRDYSTESKVESSQLLSNVDYKGKTAIIIDDIIDTCGTMISACNELKGHGLKNAIILATHGILSGKAISSIESCDFIVQVIITNSLPHDLEKHRKFTILSLGPLLSQAIYILETRGSISALFEKD